jgi:hypothetical protein
MNTSLLISINIGQYAVFKLHRGALPGGIRPGGLSKLSSVMAGTVCASQARSTFRDTP